MLSVHVMSQRARLEFIGAELTEDDRTLWIVVALVLVLLYASFGR